MKPKPYYSVSLILILTGIVAPNFILSNRVGAVPPTLSAKTSSKWRTFSPPGGDFSILMPATPEADVETRDGINLNTGKTLKQTVYSFTVDSSQGQDATVYMVSYFDSSVNSLITSSAEEELEAGLNIASSMIEVKNPGLIQRKQKLRLNGNPGAEIRLRSKDDEQGKSIAIWKRVFCTRRPNNQIRTYQVVVISIKEQALQRTLEGFVNSFKLINK